MVGTLAICNREEKKVDHQQTSRPARIIIMDSTIKRSDPRVDRHLGLKLLIEFTTKKPKQIWLTAMNPFVTSSARMSTASTAHQSMPPLAFACPRKRLRRIDAPMIHDPGTGTRCRPRQRRNVARKDIFCPQVHRMRRGSTIIFSSEYDDESKSAEDYDEVDDDIDIEMSAMNISKLGSLEDLLMDLENDLESLLEEDEDDSEDEELDENDFDSEDDVETLLALLGDGNGDHAETDEESSPFALASDLEQALLQGVVPVSAGVGSDCLPGDWGFDPCGFAEKDYILQTQFALLQAIPGAEKDYPPPPRPAALVLRDYREAEIRHGRIAMLAAIFWPLQEMLDKLLLDVDQFGPLIYGPVTLPYFPLLMTLIMMLLGYLDIYAKAIQEKEDIGDAFLPGDCFWDPLRILDGAPASMKRNMQERELFNGRVAMLAFAAYTFEEATTHLPLISVEGNELLFTPAYQIPYIQEYLDDQFSFYS